MATVTQAKFEEKRQVAEARRQAKENMEHKERMAALKQNDALTGLDKEVAELRLALAQEKAARQAAEAAAAAAAAAGGGGGGGPAAAAADNTVALETMERLVEQEQAWGEQMESLLPFLQVRAGDGARIVCAVVSSSGEAVVLVAPRVSVATGEECCLWVAGGARGAQWRRRRVRLGGLQPTATDGHGRRAHHTAAAPPRASHAGRLRRKQRARLRQVSTLRRASPPPPDAPQRNPGAPAGVSGVSSGLAMLRFTAPSPSAV